MRRRYGFKRLILIMGLLPVLVICLGFSAYLTQKQLSDSRKLMTQRAKSSAQQLSIVTSHMLADDHRKILAQVIHNALDEPGVRAVSIYDTNFSLISHAGPKTPLPNMQNIASHRQFHLADKNGELQVMWAINTSRPNDGSPLRPPQRLGWVQLSYGWHQYQLLRYQSLLSAVIFLGVSLLVCIIFFSYINHNIGRDLQVLRMSIHRLISGQRDLHIHLPGDDEFSELAEALNELNAAQLTELKDLQLNLEQSNSDLRETLETLEIQNIELDLARREAIKASRMKSEFLANTSHEIRTPLNSILGFSNILLKGDIRGRQREAVETIRNSSVNLLTIINDILDFSKLEAGKLVFDKAPLQLRELAEDTLIMLAPGAAEKNLDLALFIAPNTPNGVLGDSLRLRQVLTNLVSNAIKFTPSGSVRLEIDCSEQDHDCALLNFRVTDTGIGMNAEQRKHIFTDFAQGDASVTRQYGGTGLGLVIVQGLVQEMGGEVGVDSEPGHGSSFWFNLRLDIDHRAMQMRDFSTLAGKRITVYDRNAHYGESLCQLLESWGVTTLLCRDLNDIDGNSEHYIFNLDNSETDLSLPPLPEHASGIVLCYNSEGHSNDGNLWLGKPVSHVRLFDVLDSNLHAHKSQPGSQFPGSRILIVDDTPSNLHILSSFLEDAGITPISAQNGVEAVSLCQEQHFDLIFIDIQMPQLDGIEASRQIRQRGSNITTPIVALSAYLAPENPLQLREAGIDKYLSKPINEHQLNSILQHFLESDGAKTSTGGHLNNDNPPPPRPVDIQQCLILSKQRPELAREMLAMLLEQLPPLKEQMQAAASQQDWQTLGELNHGLKGNCCYTGVPYLQRAVVALQDELNAQTPPRAPYLQQVIKRIDELLQWQDSHELDVLFE